jgi:hydroxymethylpyrimidine pyrophosphatase-like HAD family hydrolase
MIKLISTDFDGTLFAEFEDPPVPLALQNQIARLQQQGAKWVINTGRDLSSLMEALGRSHLLVKPDFMVLVEREIYTHINSEYVESVTWNRTCDQAHAELFRRVRPDVPRLRAWIEQRFRAIYFEDVWSPFCLIAEGYDEADAIHQFLLDYARSVPNLSVVRNDVSTRFSHDAYNKGTALAEIARQLGVTPQETFAAGDHLNDLSMLSRRHARWLAAPSNAIAEVKNLVRSQEGFVSELSHGHGVGQGLEEAEKKLSKV